MTPRSRADSVGGRIGGNSPEANSERCADSVTCWRFSIPTRPTKSSCQQRRTLRGFSPCQSSCACSAQAMDLQNRLAVGLGGWGFQTPLPMAVTQESGGTVRRTDHQQSRSKKSQVRERRRCPHVQVASRPIFPLPGQVLAYCPWRHTNSELQEELIGNSFLTPQRILVPDPANQSVYPGRIRGSTGS
jgi:hypothetical protein